MAHHHLAFQLPEGVERHAHDDDDRSSAERDVHLGDAADADRQDGHERQEDTADQRDLAHQLIVAIPGVTCVKPKATLYMFPRLDPEMYPIADDQQFMLELLQEERLLLTHGTGFNWPQSDHFRLVFLPHEEDLTEAINRLARFLEAYRKRFGT